MSIHFALVGNPNVGKTTLFNALTGLSHVTGNYPGVTVERKSGTMRLNGSDANIVDLPGTYSLAARSPDEMIVADVLLGQQPGEDPIDVVLAVVDATNLERNLYLLSQLRELDKPVVVALNMMDLAERREITIDANAMAETLGVPVVPISAHNGHGLSSLAETLIEVAECRALPGGDGPQWPDELRHEWESLRNELGELTPKIGHDIHPMEAFRILVDKGGYAEERMAAALEDGFLSRLDERRTRAGSGASLAGLEARSRYGWIHEVVGRSVRKPSIRVTTASDRIDAVLTHKIGGTVIFAVLMVIVFQAIYAWAGPLMDLIDGGVGWLGDTVAAQLPEGVLQSLVVDGIITGVGSVLIFLPQILILMACVAVLEDCGYMARAAFLMDRLLSRCGLSGQSFIPILSSFACAIPGVMATRTIPDRRDRFVTMLVAPLMSCSARLPVYVLMIAAFVPNERILGGLIGVQGATLFAMYCIGIGVAIPVAWILKSTLLKGETPPFLLELPSYKWPQPRVVASKVLRQGREFLRRAGTIIFAITIIVWALAYFPHSAEIEEEFAAERAALEASLPEGVDHDDALSEIDNRQSAAYLNNSYFARGGHLIEPLVKPLGWDWRIGVATLASFPAREVVVATLGTIFALGTDVDEESDSLKATMNAATWPDGSPLFTVPVALSIMVFFALCCQCGATLAVIRRETQSWRWPAFTFTYMTVLAYVAAFIVYQGAVALGVGVA